MPIQFDTFDQQKVDRLKTHLVSQAQKGAAKFYEIYVDTLKAVPKTDEPNDFEGYEAYLTPDSEQLKIIVYNTANSPRNDQYCFVLKAKSREEATEAGLNGFPVSFSKTNIGDWREVNKQKTAERLEIIDLKKLNAELKRKLSEAESNIEQQNEIIKTAKDNANRIGGLHLGEIFSVAAESWIKRNPETLAGIPIVGELAGLMAKGASQQTETTTENNEASFKKKETTTDSALTEQEKGFIEVLHQLQNVFTEAEIGMVMEILDAMSADSSQIQPVYELLKENAQNNSPE